MNSTNKKRINPFLFVDEFKFSQKLRLSYYDRLFKTEVKPKLYFPFILEKFNYDRDVSFFLNKPFKKNLTWVGHHQRQFVASNRRPRVLPNIYYTDPIILRRSYNNSNCLNCFYTKKFEYFPSQRRFREEI